MLFFPSLGTNGTIMLCASEEKEITFEKLDRPKMGQKSMKGIKVVS
jgi:hypothetical protein